MVKKVRKPRAQKSLKKVDPERLHRKLLNAMNRDVDRLLEEGYEAALAVDGVDKIVKYTKIVRDILRDENNLTEEELEALANESPKG